MVESDGEDEKKWRLDVDVREKRWNRQPGSRTQLAPVYVRPKLPLNPVRLGGGLVVASADRGAEIQKVSFFCEQVSISPTRAKKEQTNNEAMPISRRPLHHRIYS